MDWTLLAMVLAPLLAHDTWIRAWIRGENIVGSGTTSDQFPENGDAIKRERIAFASASDGVYVSHCQSIEPHDGETELVWRKESSLVIGFQLTAHPITLDRRNFMGYLRAEGHFDHMNLLVKEENRELYTKCAKAIPKGIPLTASRHRLGHDLEIVENEVLLFGEPVRAEIQTYESKNGLVLNRAHYIRTLEGSEYQWESFWASLTYWK